MKKVFSIVLLLILLVTLIASPVYAKGNNAKGAVKADLTVFQQDTGELPKGTVVGSVVLNTTANGDLIVVINMDAVPGIEDYDVRVWINYPAYAPYTFEDVLNTNAKGNGNAQVKLSLEESVYNADNVKVSVVLRPYFSPYLGTPCYTTNWPVDVIVPLK